MLATIRLAGTLSLVGFVLAQQGAYQQCGGINWSGPKACITGYSCQVINDCKVLVSGLRLCIHIEKIITNACPVLRPRRHHLLRRRRHLHLRPRLQLPRRPRGLFRHPYLVGYIYRSQPFTYN